VLLLLLCVEAINTIKNEPKRYPLRILIKNVVGIFMTCKEAVYSEQALEYIIGNYRGEEYAREVYNPDCYMAYDDFQAVIYQEVPDITSQNIEKYGYSAIPHVYGLMNDEALEASGVLQIRRQPTLDLYGQGVLLGFVDTGILYDHEAFINADNTTRIISLWDQTIQTGDGNEQFPYGQIFERQQLNEALAAADPYAIVPSRDEIGHGTFLAGVAAGNENREEDFSGVATLSDLVVVKCKQAKNSYRRHYGIPADVPAFQENDIMAGIAYILSVARRENKQVVICLGMGTNLGNHNGGSQLSVFMDRYTAFTGVAMITAVGNEGNARHHHRILEREETIDISVEDDLEGFTSELWWRTPGGLELDLISPSGEVVEEIRAVSGTRRRHRFTPENTTVDVYFGVSLETTREQVGVFRFIEPKAGIWKIRTRFDYDVPNFHIWLPIRQFLTEEVVFLAPDPDTTVCNPSTGSDMISVSAYDVSDESLYLQASRGFTPLGNVKPEVVAPGVNLRGPAPRGRYVTMTGTSVSAALAAGIGALFMQQYRDYGVSGIALREIFIRGAMPEGEPFPNTEWGFGIVNAYESVIL